MALVAVPIIAASAPKVVLDWSASGSGCPSKPEIEAEIAALLARSSASEVRAEIRIETTPAGARAHVVTTIAGAKGLRVLEAPTCGEAAHAAAIVVALAVDPFAMSAPSASVSASTAPSVATSAAPLPSVSAPTPPPSAIPPPTATAPPTITVPPPTSPPSAPTKSETSVWLAAGPTLDSAALPGIAIGVAAQLGIEIGRVRLAGGFLALPSRRTTVENDTAGGTFSLYAGSVHGCARLFDFLAPCAAFEVGRISARGFGVRAPGSGAATWAAALAGAAATLRRGAWGGRLEGWIVLPVSQPEFVLNAVGVVHTPGIGARAVLSMEIVFL